MIICHDRNRKIGNRSLNTSPGQPKTAMGYAIPETGGLRQKRECRKLVVQSSEFIFSASSGKQLDPDNRRYGNSIVFQKLVQLVGGHRRGAAEETNPDGRVDKNSRHYARWRDFPRSTCSGSRPRSAIRLSIFSYLKSSRIVTGKQIGRAHV